MKPVMHPIDAVALSHCLHCDGVFIHPAPPPDAMIYARPARAVPLIWSEDIEMWVCPECHTPEWDIYIAPSTKTPNLFRLDADSINWKNLAEQKRELELADDKFSGIIEFLNYLQDTVVECGIRRAEDVYY